MAALPGNPHGPAYALFSKGGGAGDVTGSLSTVRSGFPVLPMLHYLLFAAIIVPTLIFAYRFVLKDYNHFLSLGRGGTPYNFGGYLKVTFLSLVFALRDPYIPPELMPFEYPATGYLNHLPHRGCPRPKVAGIAPHRQLTQKGSQEMHTALTNALKNLYDQNPTILRMGVACFEKHNLALFVGLPSARSSAPASTSPRPPTALNVTCGSPPEIVHLHSESSMHLTLHPSDAAVVIANGWGERHPLAGQGLFGRGWVPKGFVMIYAPRNEADISISMSIVRAGAWWVGGVTLGEK